MFIDLKKLIGVMTACLWLVACEQSDPNLAGDPNEVGDIRFSGYNWNVKNSNEGLMGPGLNYFSNSTDNVWVDQDGLLHLRIAKRNNKWYCSEVITTQEFGYGTYVFTVDGDLTTLNQKAVFGLFTWSDYTFVEEANSEVDVEFSRWNNPADSFLLTYSVQPVWFDNPLPYTERSRRPAMAVSKLRSTTTHVFTWTPDTITWSSYDGDSYTATAPFATWSFDKSNQPRQKIEGGRTSQPVVIPDPSTTTNARINLWLLGGLAPTDNRDIEVVIRQFRYIPR
jgi:hypothetical protein